MPGVLEDAGNDGIMEDFCRLGQSLPPCQTWSVHAAAPAASLGTMPGLAAGLTIDLFSYENSSTISKSLVLGKAKVMSYEDLVEARAKRAGKEAAKEAKGNGKRGRKCKSATPDEAITDKAKRGQKRKRAMPKADASEPKAKVVTRQSQRETQWRR
ncbi:hypothetical protein VE02_10223 [Pseudogymnoascus sp. 03VT05]|nr:hypothetical protein VE02_10223 [Pseudogymnoascus sp. 03VT05]